jgi:hypothetical protein
MHPFSNKAHFILFILSLLSTTAFCNEQDDFEFLINNEDESIGLHAFANNTILEQVHIPSATEDIHADAFYANL